MCSSDLGRCRDSFQDLVISTVSQVKKKKKKKVTMRPAGGGTKVEVPRWRYPVEAPKWRYLHTSLLT